MTYLSRTNAPDVLGCSTLETDFGMTVVLCITGGVGLKNKRIRTHEPRNGTHHGSTDADLRQRLASRDDNGATQGWRHCGALYYNNNSTEGDREMIYTRFHADVWFLLPTVAIGRGDKLWAELAWFGVAVGIKKGGWRK
jgi:hypothetical protein